MLFLYKHTIAVVGIIITVGTTASDSGCRFFLVNDVTALVAINCFILSLFYTAFASMIVEFPGVQFQATIIMQHIG